MPNIKEITPKLTQKLSIAINDDEAVEFAEALIESYKAELLKEVVEPFGYLIPHYEEMPPIFRRHPLPNGHSPLFASETLYTSDQLIAARKPLEEEIDRLKDAQFKRLEREGEKRMKLREQLATAEQRVAELEAENANLLAANRDCIEHFNAMQQDIAAAQLQIKTLRDALTEITQVAAPSPVLVYQSMEIIAKQALAKPTSTEALDAYVAEKGKEAMK